MKPNPAPVITPSATGGRPATTRSRNFVVGTSQDRVSWTATALPIVATSADGQTSYGTGRGSSVVLTRAGYIAVGTKDMDAGVESDHWTSLSEDGLTWVELPPVGTPGADSDPASVADGPAGVIGIGTSPTDPDQEVAVRQLR